MFRENQYLGKLGEDIVAQFLKKRKYKIIERNYSKHYFSGPEIGEIDIIARPKRGLIDFLLNKNKEIHFVEVKTGFYEDDFSPEMRVDDKKKNQISKMAEVWLNENHIPLNSRWQIDVISVILDRSGKVKEIKFFENI